ncbi:MAG: alkaline phosphatase D family protein [Bryobacter sp.]|nr:alkaline phosphatase D family protein [Bryobacter sp.]
MQFSRRTFASAFPSALALAASNPLPLLSQPKLTNPFSLGVASGEPAPDGAVLWTRILPPAEQAAALANSNLAVKWEVAEDEAFRKPAASGTAVASPSLAHSVHVELVGLKPARWYWYRFQAAGERSPVGRFKTAPAAGSKVDQIRFAFASCQQWTQGLWTAYQHMAAEDLDLVIHLGDYIYEQGYRGKVRDTGHEETFTLADYRNRYALYKSDLNLQAAHARFAWMTTWDDHEVSNNYANDIQEKGQPRDEFMKRRAWAYQAYYENMPLRKSALPIGPDMALYRRADFGNLLRVHMLDTRQYRSDQPCNDGLKKACEDLKNPVQTMMGPVQEKWFADGFQESRAKWDLLGQGLFVTIQDFDPGPDEVLNMDSWSGYPIARQRLVETLASRPGANPVIITGDVHASWAGQLHKEPQNVNSPCVAAEFVCTSISSGGDGADMVERVEKMMPANPQIRYFNGKRGYVRCEVKQNSWRTDYRGVDYVSKPGAPIVTKASFTIAPGSLKVERA